MKMLVSHKVNGKYAECGTNDQILRSNYKTVKGLIRYGIPEKWLDDGVRIQVWRDDNIYRDPDSVYYYESKYPVIWPVLNAGYYGLKCND